MQAIGRLALLKGTTLSNGITAVYIGTITNNWILVTDRPLAEGARG